MSISKEKFINSILFVLALAVIIFWVWNFVQQLYNDANGSAMSQLASLLIYVFRVLPAGILALILALVIGFRKGKEIIVLPLIIIAIATIPPINWCLNRILYRALIPLAAHNRNKYVEERKKENDRITLVHYQFLERQFTTPQKIVDVKGRYFILEDGKVLTLYNSGLPNDREAEYFVKSSFLGKSVILKLPDFDDFKKKYFPGMMVGVFSEQSSRERESGKPFGVIPVLISKDNRLLNMEY